MLATAPILASPLSKEPMLLYVAATNRVVSTVVVVERNEEGKSVQRPVLPKRGMISFKTELPTLPKNVLRSIHVGKKAQKLFRGTSHKGDLRSTYSRDNEK